MSNQNPHESSAIGKLPSNTNSRTTDTSSSSSSTILNRPPTISLPPSNSNKKFFNNNSQPNGIGQGKRIMFNAGDKKPSQKQQQQFQNFNPQQQQQQQQQQQRMHQQQIHHQQQSSANPSNSKNLIVKASKPNTRPSSYLDTHDGNSNINSPHHQQSQQQYQSRQKLVASPVRSKNNSQNVPSSSMSMVLSNRGFAHNNVDTDSDIPGMNNDYSSAQSNNASLHMNKNELMPPPPKRNPPKNYDSLEADFDGLFYF